MLKRKTLCLLLALATVIALWLPAVGAQAAETLATPKITSVSGSAGSVKIVWGKVDGAAKYRVFCKNSSGGWSKIADTESSSYTWTGAKANTAYTFTARCVSADGKSFTSAYDTKGTSYTVPAGALATPKITSVTSSGTKVTVTWGKVAGAEKYRLFCKKNGKWTTLKDTAATSVTLNGTVGKTYTYTVRCLSGDGTKYTSDYDKTGKSISLLLDTPRITSVTTSVERVSATVTADFINIQWNAVSGAAKYRVFYKTAGTGWKKLADTAATKYSTEKIGGGWPVSGTTYTFTVRCVSADGATFTSQYDTAGKSLLYIDAPTASLGYYADDGLGIYVRTVPGATRYRLFYKTNTGSWTKIADVKPNVSDQKELFEYFWNGAKRGTYYAFTARALSADGKSYISAYRDFNTYYLYLPGIWTNTNYYAGGGTITIFGEGAMPNFERGVTPWYLYQHSYSNVVIDSGVTTVGSYAFYGCGNLRGVTIPSSVTSIGKGAFEGCSKSLIFYCEAGSYAEKYARQAGFTVKSPTLAPPNVASVSSDGEKIYITWIGVPGAAQYRVFYRTVSGSWTKLADTADTRFVWDGAQHDTLYYFTVRCLSADGKSYTSDYNATGRGVTHE